MSNNYYKIAIKIFNASENTEKIDWLFKTIKDIYVQNLVLNANEAKNCLKQGTDIIIFNLDEINHWLIEFFKSYIKEENLSNIILVIQFKSINHISSLIRMGLDKIYFYPDDEFQLRQDIIELVDSLKLRREAEFLREQTQHKFSFDNLIGKSPRFLECVQIAKKIAKKSDSTVLLLGETGTGKELFAKAIHYNSPRSNEPFIELNTSAISESLFESELFGYEKGAFTDAKISKPGLLEIAENGTAFLDEIGDLSFNLQVKLLRAIENKSIKRIGGLKDIKINCRIIAATNQNLEKLVDEKKFRADLYYRLKVFSIYLPPLRERKEDIIPLAEHFIKTFNQKYNTSVEGLSKKAKEILILYSWPGNIRELSNVIERAILLSSTKVLSEKDIQLGSSSILTSMKKNFIELRFDIDNANIKKVNYELAKEVLKLVGENKTRAAKILGITRQSLLKLLNEQNSQ